MPQRKTKQQTDPDMEHHTKQNILGWGYKITQLSIMLAMFVSVWILLEVLIFESILSGEALLSIPYGRRLQIAVVLFAYIQVGQNILLFFWYQFHKVGQEMHLGKPQ